MCYPLSKETIIEAVEQYRVFNASNGDLALYPNALEDIESKVTHSKMMVGSLLHSLLFIFILMLKKLRLWWLVFFFAKIRIATDSWSFEPRQCGYNQAYTWIGLYELQNKNIPGAISALRESWHVYPCPHNTTFGLSTDLLNALTSIPEAELAVSEYVEIYTIFTS